MAKEQTVGELINELVEVDEKISALNKQIKELNPVYTAIELKLLEALKKQGLEQSRGTRALATISRQIVARVPDWDKAYAWIMKHKQPYLFEKRISAKPFRELLEARNGKPIPGIEAFEKVSISLRSIT